MVCLVFLTMLMSTCLKKTERAPAEQETREKPELAAEKELLEADGEKFETFFADQRIKPEKAGLGMCRENPGKEGEKADVYETEE